MRADRVGESTVGDGVKLSRMVKSGALDDCAVDMEPNARDWLYPYGCWLLWVDDRRSADEVLVTRLAWGSLDSRR